MDGRRGRSLEIRPEIGDGRVHALEVSKRRANPAFHEALAKR
jgi:hypothetical protein